MSACLQDLDKNAASFQPMKPLSLQQQTAAVCTRHTAIIHGGKLVSYDVFYERCRTLVSALRVMFTELPKTSTGKIQKFKLRETAKR